MILPVSTGSPRCPLSFLTIDGLSKYLIIVLCGISHKHTTAYPLCEPCTYASTIQIYLHKIQGRKFKKMFLIHEIIVFVVCLFIGFITARALYTIAPTLKCPRCLPRLRCPRVPPPTCLKTANDGRPVDAVRNLDGNGDN